MRLSPHVSHHDVSNGDLDSRTPDDMRRMLVLVFGEMTARSRRQQHRPGCSFSTSDVARTTSLTGVGDREIAFVTVEQNHQPVTAEATAPVSHAAPANRQWSVRDRYGHVVPCGSRAAADQWIGHPGLTVVLADGDCRTCDHDAPGSAHSQPQATNPRGHVDPYTVVMASRAGQP